MNLREILEANLLWNRTAETSLLLQRFGVISIGNTPKRRCLESPNRWYFIRDGDVGDDDSY